MATVAVPLVEEVYGFYLSPDPVLFGFVWDAIPLASLIPVMYSFWVVAGYLAVGHRR